ncbi:MAG: hypothetical protein KIT84_00605 [Labilithrix sp.]|nr:hypothetical protein [Labilithrix sp.]MCW5809484.1 hypothetical protein [Labilithrix sp.]
MFFFFGRLHLTLQHQDQTSMQHTRQQYMPEIDVEPTERYRVLLYFSPDRPRAITRDAWTALKKKYKTWRDEHLRLAAALADLLLADLAAHPPQE